MTEAEILAARDAKQAALKAGVSAVMVGDVWIEVNPDTAEPAEGYPMLGDCLRFVDKASGMAVMIPYRHIQAIKVPA